MTTGRTTNEREPEPTEGSQPRHPLVSLAWRGDEG
jgi:hypothetical protein